MLKNFTPPKYFDDLHVGDVFLTPGRTVMDCDVREFSMLAGIFEETFNNYEYAMNESVFKGRVAQGPLTLAISFGLGLQCGWMHGTVQALLGIDQMRVVRPTYVNDTIHMEIEVAELREPRSRPTAGIVIARNTVFNQRQETVLTYLTRLMLARRVPEAVGSAQ